MLETFVSAATRVLVEIRAAALHLSFINYIYVFSITTLFLCDDITSGRMTDPAESEELERMCKYAKLVRARDSHAFRDDVLFCSNIEASVNNEFIQRGCVSSNVFPSGHSRLDAYLVPEKIYECPFRERRYEG